ncbi:YadA-like family protein, partial [Pseudomonas fluorescens]|uniref:YadA family autotransporter adhesin n=1 Tax=Pseudomonas fluorescens TaxID=294 RepID=UPI0019089E57
ANEAKSDAGTALSTANTAMTDAGNARIAANDAKTDANNALKTADKANSDAVDALATAKDAKTESAVAKADARSAIDEAQNASAIAEGAKSDVDKNIAAFAHLTEQVGRGEMGLVKQSGPSEVVTVAKDRGGDEVSFSGEQGERRLSGVAAGNLDATSNDAVNGGQVFALNQQIQKLRTASSAVSIDSKDDGSETALAKAGAQGVAIGAGTRADGQKGVAIGSRSSATGDGGVAIGSQASASAAGSVAIGKDAQADRVNSVSVGARGAERQITNVASATEKTDGVNLGQAESIARQSTAQGFRDANVYTDSKIADLRRDAYAGTAAAMAMAALPQASSAGRGMVSLSGSTFEGQSATAIGVSAVSTDGRWVYNASGAATTRGNLGATVGVGYQW